MAVNREAEHLQAGLAGGVAALAAGGRMAVISFHSGEDRIVKQFFRAEERERRSGRVLTRKPLTPSEAECARNAQARSAKMRVFARTEEAA